MNTYSSHIVHFLRHTLIAAFLFFLVAVVATTLWFFTERLKDWGAPEEIWVVLHWVAIGLFIVDVLSLAAFIALELAKYIASLIADWKTS